MFKKSSLLLVFALTLTSICQAEDYPDLLQTFKTAHDGQPLRCVAIGGSITQAGKGWIGPWLRKTFPKSIVNMHNAGMSATGSMLGMFRIDRDVISCQPDLVLIEYAVNDGGSSDVDTYWTLESMVRRLKTLPNPPAIVFLLAASKNKSKVYRHIKIAEHYGLKIVNLQTATDNYLKKEKQNWKELFSDAVHPNTKGHEFYAQAITKELEPIAKQAAGMEGKIKLPALPKQYSKRKLILDGRMVPIAVAPGWQKQQSLPHWWDMFFMGVTTARKPGTSMKITFQGTVAGLFYALNKKYGMFYANIDGKGFREVICNHRGGYAYSIFGKELTPETHILNIALPEKSKQGQGVKLGFLLLGGETGAKSTVAKQNALSIKLLTKLSFEPVTTENWHWVGPFGDISASWIDNKKLHMIYPPEKDLDAIDHGKTYSHTNGKKLNWQKAKGQKVDFSQLTNYKDRGICYATTRIKSDKAEEKQLIFRVDYWGKVWINGKLVLTVDQGHGAPHSPIFFKAKFKKGWNDIMVKVHSGSLGNNFSLEMQK